MGRTEAKSGLVAKRPMATTLGASLARDVSVFSMVADLEGRDLDGLRRQWRAHLGGEAPAHLPRWLLMRVLAYRLQSNAFGDFDKSIRRNLRSEKDDGVGVPFDTKRSIRFRRPGPPRQFLCPIMFLHQLLDLGVHDRGTLFPDFVRDRRAGNFERFNRRMGGVAGEPRFVPVGPYFPPLVGGKQSGF